MNRIEDLQAIRQITDAQYQRKLQSFQQIVAQELKLRAQLARLDAQLSQSQHGSSDQSEMRAIGADIMWQAWVGRTKEQLNLQLARVLAIKEHQQAEMRQAFGKAQVTAQLLSDTQRDRMQKETRDALSRAMDQSLFG